MDQHRRQQIDSITALSKRMLQRARADEWDEVASLEEQRRVLVMQCFNQVTAERDVLELGPAIREIIVLNDELIELGKRCRGKLGGDIHVKKIGGVAKRAYSSCAR